MADALWQSKAPEMRTSLRNFCKGLFGTDPEAGECATCGKKIGPDGFRDDLSRREYAISGMCQDCQDSVFG